MCHISTSQSIYAVRVSPVNRSNDLLEDVALGISSITLNLSKPLFSGVDFWVGVRSEGIDSAR